MKVITTAHKRVSEIASQDVVFVTVGKAGKPAWQPAWRFVYDALRGDDFDPEEFGQWSVDELVKVAGPIEDLEFRDTLLRVALDEDRSEGAGSNLSAWVVFRNPYELIEFQIEVKDP